MDVDGTILGHKPQRKALFEMLAADRLPNSLLFAGIPGIGKALVARELAQSIFCESFSKKRAEKRAAQEIYGGCGECQQCRLFKAGNTADFYQVECLDRENWNVQRIRQLLYSLHLKPFAGSSRVVLFNDAEHLSDQIANVLLKALEEPRANTYFVLICSNYSKLPATIVSRCQVWHFDALSEELIVELLKRRTDWLSEQLHSEELDFSELAKLADGSMGDLQKIVEASELWTEIKEKLDLISAATPELASSYAQELAKNRDSLRVVLQLLRIQGRSKMLQPANSQIQRAWAEFLLNLISAERLIFDRNLAASYVLHYTFMILASSLDQKQSLLLHNNKRLLEQVVVN